MPSAKRIGGRPTNRKRIYRAIEVLRNTIGIDVPGVEVSINLKFDKDFSEEKAPEAAAKPNYCPLHDRNFGDKDFCVLCPESDEHEMQWEVR